MLDKCEICPRKCKINREEGFEGYCKCNDKIKIALVSTHYFEEPCISGRNGSGTIFFSNCNMNCVFCQNYEISQNGKGLEITIERLAEIMIEQQQRGVNNINLVTPTMYVYQIIDAIKIAQKNGLKIPIIYNTNGYENLETIKLLKGYIDIYLPDLKYYSDLLSMKYSNTPNYFENAISSILEMQRQVGKPIFEEEKLYTNNQNKNDNGKDKFVICKGSDGIEKKIKIGEDIPENNMIMKSGMIVRHLILPNHLQNTKHILKWIKDNMPSYTYVSIMAQYFPTYKAKSESKYLDINRKINKNEYEEIEKYLFTLNLKNGYMQDLGKHEEEYVPNFDYKNIEK